MVEKKLKCNSSNNGNGISSNIYTVEINNDSNLIIVSENVGYCTKCFKKIDVGLRFCDRECQREYYAEINSDLSGFCEGN